MSEAGKRFGTEAALNWMRVRAKALTKRRQQGAGLVEVLPEQEEQVSDDESGCMGPDASIEASFMALQDFQVGQGGPLSDMERKQVWWILRRRQREKQQQEETGKVDVPVEGAEAKEEPGSTWISSQDQEDFETIEEDDELTMLVHFLQTNRGLQKLPPAQIQWLAARLEPEVVPQEVLHDSEKEKHDKVVGKAALAFLKKGDTKERLLVHSDSPRSTDHATSFSARLLQQAREMSAVNSSEQKSKTAKLRILVHGDAQWKGSGSLRPGDIMVDLPSFMPSWYRWEPENKDPLACSELLVASTPIDDEFVARLGSPFQCAAERAAAFHAASKLPGMRSMSDLAMISHYLRRMPMFALSQDSLEAVAYALQVRVLQKNEVLTWEGQTPAEILIPLSVVITAWRSLPEGAAPSAHKRIRADAILSARSALEAPQVMRTASRRSQGLHSSGLEARAAPQTCVDVILKDHHVRHSEWALAAGYKCSVSLVSLSNGKAFCVSKNEYQRHVQQHRSQNAPLEVTAFLAGSIPQEHLSATDLNWLEETPLARCACLRVLPRVVRKHILGSGRLQRLPAQNWLCREEETLDSCFMLIHGKLELKLPNQSAQEEEATRILQPGAVIGDSVFAFGQSDASWAHHYRAAGEECLLYEVPRPAFQAAIKQLPKAFQDPKAAEMEEALQMPSSARSFQQLQLLSSVLEKQEPYNTVDAFARIELCQNVSFRHLSCGDDLEMSSQCSCQILRGEASIRLKGEMQVEVIRIPSGAFIGEEVGMSGDFLLHAMEDTRLFWLDKSQLPQGKGAVVHHAGEKALDKASADRNRAIQTLKFKAPEQRSLEDVALLVKLLQNNKFFNEQEESLLKEICRGMSYTEFSRHSVIIKQGDIADVCYVLLKGTAGVWVDSTKPKEDDENPTEIPDGNDLQLLSPTSLNSPRTIKSPAEVPETPTSAVKRLKQADGMSQTLRFNANLLGGDGYLH
ncbi:unnamed protein product [Effrenium voratum]|uniref:Cyclic nucleotide-binding domain-containing protein n=1 Tax=Effrenium voratum TaxID=2562239 RepID=A0AA36MVT5_9DINO|nr:unnamed protein product [Effrenium voratum]